MFGPEPLTYPLHPTSQPKQAVLAVPLTLILVSSTSGRKHRHRQTLSLFAALLHHQKTRSPDVAMGGAGLPGSPWWCSTCEPAYILNRQ